VTWPESVMYFTARWRWYITDENLTSVDVYFFTFYLLLLTIPILAIFPREYLGTDNVNDDSCKAACWNCFGCSAARK
jgi:hypothetical protein